MIDAEHIQACNTCSSCEAKRIADNLEYIAASFAKLTERCFCGHRLDQHTPACTVENCEIAKAQDGKTSINCKTFTPWFLAMARIGNHISSYLAVIANVLALPLQEEQPTIVTPFKQH